MLTMDEWAQASFGDATYTYHFSKYSCLRSFYFIHIVFNWLITISGLWCFLSRLWPRLYWTHAWSGRLYFVFMIWSMASSLLIHNTGLGVAVLFSFLWVLLGMTIAWFLIVLHQQKMTKQVPWCRAIFARDLMSCAHTHTPFSSPVQVSRVGRGLVEYLRRVHFLRRIFPERPGLSPLLKRPLWRENPLVVSTVAWSG